MCREDGRGAVRAGTEARVVERGDEQESGWLSFFLFSAYFGLFCLISSHMVLLNQPAFKSAEQPRRAHGGVAVTMPCLDAR